MTAADHDYLPEVLAEIAEVAGLDAALKLASARGGTSVYIPAHLPADHWLVETVGPDAARQIVEHFRSQADTGISLLIPIGRRAQAGRVLANALEKGASAREAARLAGLHERTAWRMRARLKAAKDDEQGSLF